MSLFAPPAVLPAAGPDFGSLIAVYSMHVRHSVFKRSFKD